MNSKLIQISKIINLMTKSADEIEHKILARAIGTVIFDIPVTKSGMVSVGLIDEYGFRPSIAKCTKEHFHSRNESGYQIIKMMTSGGTFDELCEYLSECSMVHLTTKEENITLSGIQNHPLTKHLTWEEQYELAGIELVEDPGTMPRKLQNKLKKG